MKVSLPMYVCWEISDIDTFWEYFKYRVHTYIKGVKQDVFMAIQWNVEVGDEVEYIEKKMDIEDNLGVILARHNISKWIKEKMDEKIKFPAEVFEDNILNHHDIRKQQLHMLYQNARWLQGLYRKYNYLLTYWWNIWWARDPNCEKTFKTPKQYFDNARHICFFYNIVKGREEVRDAFDERLLNSWVFDSIIKNYYMEFLIDIKNIPDTYPTIEEFGKHFADIRDEVGL